MKEIFELAVKQRPVRQQHINNLKTTYVRTTTFGTKSLTVLGPNVWNKLPTHLKSAKNLFDFKNIIKEWDGESCSCPRFLFIINITSFQRRFGLLFL